MLTPTAASRNPTEYFATIDGAMRALGYRPDTAMPTVLDTADGAYLIAQVASCPGEMTGHCWAVLFFLNDRYVGASSEARTITNIRGVPGTGIAADFPDYTDGAPMCCPNAWTTYVFSWDGRSLVTAKGPSVASPVTSTPAATDTPEADPAAMAYEEGGIDALLSYIANDLGINRGFDDYDRKMIRKLEAACIMWFVSHDMEQTFSSFLSDWIKVYLEDDKILDVDAAIDSYVSGDADKKYEQEFGIEASFNLLAATLYGKYSPLALETLVGERAKARYIADYYAGPFASGMTFMEFLISPNP